MGLSVVGRRQAVKDKLRRESFPQGFVSCISAEFWRRSAEPSGLCPRGPGSRSLNYYGTDEAGAKNPLGSRDAC